MVINYRLINNLRTVSRSVLISVLALPLSVMSEIYIYQGSDGEKLVSDRPVPGYTLLTKRDTMTDVGHILADRHTEPGSRDQFKAHIRAASDRYRVEPALIEAVIQVESSFRPDAVSSAGATGLMQLMAATARDLEVKDRFNARDNIHGGVRYISDLMLRFNNDITLVVAAYHAGPGAVERAGDIPDKPETQRYVRKVLQAYSEFRSIRYGDSEVQ